MMAKNSINVSGMQIFKFIITLIFVAYSNFTEAMVFKLINEPEFEYKRNLFPARISIFAKGEINKNDASTFKRFLENSSRDQYGNITLYLDSSGGNVQESLLMAKLMDRFEVTAIVPSGSVCVSACASILFISARIHFVEEGGYLALHPCKFNQEYVIELCNDAIAQNAVYHGTSHAAVRGFMDVGVYPYLPDQYKPRSNKQDLVYFGRTQSILYGLYGPPLYDSTLAIPSFNCSKAADEVDKLVCNEPQLARYDASLEVIYLLLKKLFISYPDEWQKIKELKLESEKLRKQCGHDYDCILDNYSDIRGTFRSMYARQHIIYMKNSIKDLDESEFMVGFLMSTLDWCRDPDECWYNYIPERPHQFFRENLVMQSIKDMASGENLVGYLGCQFGGLCDATIKQYSVEEMAREAVKIAEAKLHECARDHSCDEKEELEWRRVLSVLKETIYEINN